MVQKIFYNSSLPRSGSTLFQNVFNQNPSIYATPTSGLVQFLEWIRITYGQAEFKAQQAELMEKATLSFCREGMYGYANALSSKPYFIDKSFYWGMHFNYLKMIHNGQNPKIVIMIRDLRDIFASFESNFRKNTLVINPNVDWDNLEGTTMEKRLIDITKKKPVGPVLDGLKDIINYRIDSKILFVKYEDFCIDPIKEMNRVYNYLEIPYFEHDFNNVHQTTKEDDRFYFVTHKIRNVVEKKESEAIQVIGKPACEWVYKNYEWFFKFFNYSK
jgi:sulfotransferase